MRRLVIALFGGFHVELDGEPVHDFRTARARGLLAYLAIEAGRTHPRDRLAALLWPEVAPAAALQSLRQAIYALRQALGDGHAGLLHVTRTEVQLAGAPQVSCDVTRFRRHLAAGALADAVALYHGDLLAGFDAGSAALDTWLATVREQCHRQALDALETLADRALAGGDWREARHLAQRQLAIEPWREAAHGQVMQALAMMGDRSGALAQYEACREIMLAELGAPPGQAITELHAQIQTGALRAAASTPVDIDHVQTPIPHNLPPRGAPIHGRDVEIDRIATLLARPDCRLVTIAGPGGIGKTRLAHALAWRFVDANAFPGGVYFVDLTAIREAPPLLAALAEPLAIPAFDRRPLEEQLAAHLAGQPVLFVIDNFEQAIAHAATLATLLAAAPDLKLLVTSRRALDLQEEWHVPIDGLPFPAEESLPAGEAALLAFPAVAMFADRAHLARPGFVLGDNAASVARICRMVAGLPLAIELAAARLAHDSAVSIAAAIAANVETLALDAPGLPERHRSLRALMDQTWQELSEPERLMLTRLGVFTGGFTLPAAQAVSGIGRAELDGFIRASLVRYHPERGRYSLHELLRQYAAGRLDLERENSALTVERHSEYFCGWVESVEPELKGARAQTMLAAIEADLENILAAWVHAARAGNVGRVYAAVEGVNVFFLRRHRHREGLGACEKIGDLLGAGAALEVAPGNPHTANLLAMLEVWQARFHQLCDELTAAHGCIFRALRRVEDGGVATRPAKAAALLQLGHLQLSVDRRQAKHCYTAALALYRAMGDRWNEANVLAAQAGVAQVEGAYAEAEKLGVECLALRRGSGAPSAIAQAIYDLAVLARRRLDLARAEQMLGEARTLYGQADHAFGIAATTGELAIVRAYGCRYHEAATLFQEAFARLDSLRRRQPKAQLLFHYVLTQMSLARYAEMASWAMMALELARAMREPPSEAAAAVTLALHRSIVGLADEAGEWLDVADAIYARVESQYGPALVAAARGSCAVRIAEWDVAVRAVNLALRDSVTVRAPLALALALTTQVQIALACGDHARAVEAYADAERLPYVGNSPHFLALVGRPVREAARQLGRQAAEAAAARGRSRAVWSVRAACPETWVD